MRELWFLWNLDSVNLVIRPIVDMKWLPKERIVDYFITLYGMMNSELIIAIDKDPYAPMSNAANYGITKDLFEVLPQLISKIRGMRKGALHKRVCI